MSAAVVDLGKADHRRRLCADVRRATAETVRAELLMHAPNCTHDLPPPHDLESERALVGALLAGHLVVSDFAPLRAVDFYHPLHRVIVVAVDALGEMDREATPAMIIAALRAQDVVGADDELADAILALRDGVPFVVAWTERRDRVLELARRRELLSRIADTAAALRTGTLNADEAARRLKGLGA